MHLTPALTRTDLSEKLVSLSRWSKVLLMVAADSMALPFCVLAAVLLRLGSLESALDYGLSPYIIIAAITVATFTMCGLYRAVIRFIDLCLLTTAGIGLGIVVLIAYTITLPFNDQTLPRSAAVIYWFIAFSYVVSSRMLVRSFLRKGNAKNRANKHIVAIYGAGEAGAQLAQAIRMSKDHRAVCFFDDMQSLDNQNVAGLKVFHSSRLASIKQLYEIDLIVLAIPSATAECRREIVHMARQAGVEIKTLHSIMELSADEEITAKSIREIKIEDLLGREPVVPDTELFAKCVTGKNILVTGGGGSIGSELCRQISILKPLTLHLLDHSEFSLYAISQELYERFPGIKVESHLGSVCDTYLVDRIVKHGGIDTIYHAAAYKHVPLIESNISVGIRNNVTGAEVIVAAAEKYQVETCVLVSSDKAVRPTNIMGATKRIAELIFQAAATNAESSTTFCMVRFGNVLGSSGSVVPLFQKQIEQGGPITITHPDMTRYFMLIPEAAQLVIQAGAMAKGGEVFVLDMGEPVKIVDLARTMIEMSGLEAVEEFSTDAGIAIRYVGLRDGEKLFEELLIDEDASASTHPRIMYAKENALAPEILETLIDNLKRACHRGTDQEIKSVMQKIVAEYAPQNAGTFAALKKNVVDITAKPISIAVNDNQRYSRDAEHQLAH